MSIRGHQPVVMAPDDPDARLVLPAARAAPAAAAPAAGRGQQTAQVGRRAPRVGGVPQVQGAAPRVARTREGRRGGACG